MLFNLANQYHANKMYAEALNTYQVIVKNKMFSNAGKPNFVLFCNICSRVLQYALPVMLGLLGETL